MPPDKRKISLSAEDFILCVARHILKTKGAACLPLLPGDLLWSFVVINHWKSKEENVSKGAVGETDIANEVIITYVTHQIFDIKIHQESCHERRPDEIFERGLSFTIPSEREQNCLLLLTRLKWILRTIAPFW